MNNYEAQHKIIIHLISGLTQNLLNCSLFKKELLDPPYRTKQHLILQKMERDDPQFSGGRRYRNDQITVYWKPSACVHASYCYRELIEVFDPARRPWVDIDGAPTPRIIETVNLCPTEALTWKWNNEERNKDVSSDQTNHIKFKRPELQEPENQNDEKPVTVKIVTDGPMIIKGNFSMTYDGNTKEVQNGIVSICRCGTSEHMPFCDGRHSKTEFSG